MKNFSLPSTPPQIPRNDISSRTKRGRKTRLAQVLSGETPRPFQTPGLEGWRVSDRFVFYDYVGINEGVTPARLRIIKSYSTPGILFAERITPSD